jgi:cytochrome c-type biogenesis protein CcmE
VKPRQKRAMLIAAGLATLAVAAALVLGALKSNIALYVTPSEVAAGKAPQGRAFRIGGLVRKGSMSRDNLTVHFVVTDLARDISVSYTGILPDLFKEGRGAVIEGKLMPDGTFVASEVLAKHDENYMPPEAKSALDAARQDSAAGKP